MTFSSTAIGEELVSIGIQIKVAGIDLNKLRSNGKIFRVGDREYHTSRFGTWAFRELLQKADLTVVLSEGGIAIAITWAIWKRYKGVSAWVQDVHQNRFILDVKNGQQRWIRDEICSGKMAKTLESCLKDIQATKAYRPIRVRSISIMPYTDEEKAATENQFRFGAWMHTTGIIQAERVKSLMDNDQYMQSFFILKENLRATVDETARLQMLLRLCTCALELRNFRQMEDAFPAILTLAKKVTVHRNGEIESYLKDFNDLHALLLAFGSGIRAIELAFAFHDMVKLISNAGERMDAIVANIDRVCTTMNAILASKPSACLKSRMLHYAEKVELEIEFVETMEECDPLVRHRHAYYARFNLAEIKDLLDQKVEVGFRGSAAEFQRTGNCWADLPYVLRRLQLHPEVFKHLGDEAFRESVEEICNEPSLLEQRIKDPKIALANEVLSSEFGIFACGSDPKKARAGLGALGKTAFAYASRKMPREEKPIDEKQEAEKEKEMGNTAYKKKMFQKAHCHYDRAIALDPTNALLHSNKAAVYISQGALDEARWSCLTAISLTQRSDRHGSEDVAKITARLAHVEFLDGNLGEALVLYQRSLRLHSNPKVREQMKECEEKINLMRFMNAMRSPFF